MERALYICILSVLCSLSLGAVTTQEPKQNGSTGVTSKVPPPTSQAPTSQTPTSPSSKSTPTTQHTGSTTPALSPAEQCMQANGSCDKCVKVGKVQCVWCNSKKTCVLKSKVIPTDECSLADARWAVCWLNYEALIIAVSVIGGLLILGITICICCCCCCRKGNKEKWAREDAKVERQKTERKAKNAEKRAERKAKTDEIRRKYGLTGAVGTALTELEGLIKDDTPYSRFNNEA